MIKWVNIYLIVTGIAAAAALLMPSLVVLGTFLLILPGLFLALAPTAFMWGCAFAIFWFPLRGLIGDWLALLVSLPLALGLMWLATRAENAEAARRFAALVEPDVEVSRPLALQGHILLKDNRRFGEQRRSSSGEKFPSDPGALCSPLCTALLFSDGVRGVTVERRVQQGPVERASFRLKRKEDCRTPIPLTKAAAGGEALTLYWTSRLDEGFCIDREDAPANPDMVITVESETFHGQTPYGTSWSLSARPVMVERLTVERGADLSFRRSLVFTNRLTSLLAIEGGGTMENFHFGWARKPLTNQPRHWELNANRELEKATTIRLSVDAATSRAGARRTIAAALDDPVRPATDQAFAVVPTYFSSFLKIGRNKAPPPDRQDFDLLLRLVSDRRVANFNGVGHVVGEMGDAAAELRAPIVARVAAAQPDELPGLKPLAAQLSFMPKGLFAQMTPLERSLVEDPDLRKRVPALVYRLHDQGTASVPLIGRILEEHLRLHEERRNLRDGPHDGSDMVMIDRARMALCQLGIEGKAALPLIAKLEAEGLVDRLAEGRDWQLMLARIGRPVADIPKPSNLSGTEAQFHDRLNMRLQKFRADRDCRPGW